MKRRSKPTSISSNRALPLEASESRGCRLLSRRSAMPSTPRPANASGNYRCRRSTLRARIPNHLHPDCCGQNLGRLSNWSVALLLSCRGHRPLLEEAVAQCTQSRTEEQADETEGERSSQYSKHHENHGCRAATADE